MKALRTIIIAKAPLAGFAKTRLIPALGADGAARLAMQMLHHSITTALEANIGTVELCSSPEPNDAVWRQFDLPTAVQMRAQGEGDLGERMARAANRALKNGEAVMLVGTDCPAINVNILQQVALALNDNDACMIPTFDGGYVLLGLNQFDASIFNDMRWSTDTVAQVTFERMQKLKWKCKLFPKLHDIDEAADLVYLPLDWQNQQAISGKP
ncbi:MAG TPA: TIGR04282 family arsenosugar biosynthesis glycosyltransferase [Burkholderiaceae bacterium]|nr:TIGR04282 family arsenosugar biosynthesis glycosyltransferase [Burkholderiaceae bacterium]